MPDVTLMVQDLADAENAERLELALKRLEFVNEANADAEKGLVAVSYEGGEAEQSRLEQAGARKLEE
jgi:hypothetical protein